MDVLGAFDRFELYAALVVDAPDGQTAANLARVGSLDPALSWRDRLELYGLVRLNHPAPVRPL